MNKQTLRLVVPDWQAGNNPIYALGAKILAAIAPEPPPTKKQLLLMFQMFLKNYLKKIMLMASPSLKTLY